MNRSKYHKTRVAQALFTRIERIKKNSQLSNKQKRAMIARITKKQ
jgi:hypothetical protein